MTYEYEKDTRQAYRDVHKARAYQKIHSREDIWAQFASWRVRVIVQRILARCGLHPHEKILDIPCGTGTLGSVFRNFPHQVLAADISLEMIDLARSEYVNTHLLGFVQSDITQLPFAPGEFACIVILGLMHRMPAAIRRRVLAEIASLRPKYVIITYSIDSLGQRLKKRLLKKLRPSQISAPVPVPYGDIIQEVNSAGFKVSCTQSVVPLLSAQIVLALENRA